MILPIYLYGQPVLRKPTEDITPETLDLQQLFVEHNYPDAVIYGHALEGNYHFIINQSLSTDEEVARYHRLIEEVAELVVDKYDGSLKAEHGTGRNMAPFVEREWGAKAYEMMCRVKRAFDSENLLNPGVIFNDDKECYLKNFKQLPILHPADDASEDVIRNRIEIYRQQTAIVADYYTKQQKYSAINGLGTMDEVFERLCQVIDQKR